MSVDELKSQFTRLAGVVVPDEDPYGQLMRRARRRRVQRSGLGTALAGLLVAVLGFGSGWVGGWPGEPPTGTGDGYRVNSAWTWRLIMSPTRGNLADDPILLADLTSAFDEKRGETGMALSLPSVKVLFAHDFATARSVVVAYHSDSAAGLVTRTAQRGASPDTLVASGGMSNGRLSPFTVVSESLESRAGWSTQWLLGLAPAGCTVRSSRVATVNADNTITRSWWPSPTGDHLLHEAVPVAEQWQVTCAGVVRHQGPAGHGVAEIDGGPAAEAPRRSDRVRGTVDEATARAALTSYRTLVAAAGLTTADPVVLWAGSVPDGEQPRPAVLLGPAHGVGPVLFQAGTARKTLVALAGRDQATPDRKAPEAASRAGWSLVSTGVQDRTGTAAVRVPERQGGRAVLGERLLVAGSPDAVFVGVDDRDDKRIQGPFADGAGLTVAPLHSHVAVQTLDANGKRITSVWLAPTTGEHLFGEELVSDW